MTFVEMKFERKWSVPCSVLWNYYKLDVNCMFNLLKHWVNNICRNVKKMRDYGKSVEWPRPPSRLQGLFQLLQKVHGRYVHVLGQSSRPFPVWSRIWSWGFLLGHNLWVNITNNLIKKIQSNLVFSESVLNSQWENL